MSAITMLRTTGFLLAVTLVFNAAALGQDTPADPPLPSDKLAPRPTSQSKVEPQSAKASETELDSPEEHVVYVPYDSLLDESFQIAVVFETPSTQKRLGVTDQLELPLPQFAPGAKFQRVYVRAWVPQNYRLVGDPKGFTSHIGVGLWNSRQITPAPDNPDSWFPDDTSAFDFQVGGTTYLFSSMVKPGTLRIDYWHIPTMTLIASLLVLVIGVVLVPFSLETKVFAVLTVVFGFSCAGHIKIAKLRGDWQAINLPFCGLAVESARVGDQPARFGRRENGTRA